MEEEIKLSRDVFKTVSVDTRVDILKLLDKRQMTASEISRALDKHVTTISEHLEVLNKSNMVQRIERPGHKWIYYKLTHNATEMLHPKFYYRWAVILSISLLVLSIVSVPFVNANPGDLLYPVERFVEKVRLGFANEEGKAHLHLEYAEKRLEEAKIATEKNDTKSAKESAEEYKKSIEESTSDIEKVKDKGKDVKPLLEEVDEATSKHISILENIEKKKPELKKEVDPILEYSKANKAKIKQELE